MNMSPIFYKSNYECLFINPSYYIYILFNFGSFPYNVSIGLGLPHPTIVHFSHYQCGHTIDGLNNHLLWCLCGSERSIAYNILWDIVTTIDLESGAHIHRKFPTFSLATFNNKVNILITRYGFWTLANTIIANLTCPNMLQHASYMIVHDKKHDHMQSAHRETTSFPLP